jgi:hypothetical protein
MPKSGKPSKTRILQSAGIEYSLEEYDVDDRLDAVTVAGKIGSDPDRVFKTLVARGDRSGVEVFCIPAATGDTLEPPPRPELRRHPSKRSVAPGCRSRR